MIPPDDVLTTMEITGVQPLTSNLAGNKRDSYRAWLAALDEAAAACAVDGDDLGPFSVTMELRLYTPWGQGSDLDNYVKPIQDALAEHGVFGPPEHERSSMKGDERIDHLELRRRLVSSTGDAGVRVEVRRLSG